MKSEKPGMSVVYIPVGGISLRCSLAGCPSDRRSDLDIRQGARRSS
jgi:hypothetical protein